MMRAHIIVPRELLEEVDKLVGRRKRSKFFVEAAEERLRRKRLLQLAEEFAGSMKGKGPREWETPEGSVAWVREQRETRSERGKWLEENWLPKPDPALVTETERRERQR